MSRRALTRTATRVAAVAGAGAMTVVALGAPAVAATADDVEVVNTETVQAYTDATGAVKSKRGGIL